MSRFLFLADPAKGTRIPESFLAAPLGGMPLEASRFTVGGVAVGLQSAPSTPRATVREADGFEASVLGRADGLAAEDLAAQMIASARGGDFGGVAHRSGYFVALAVEGRRCWVIADLLGLFPVYYACHGGVVRVGSSPASVLASGGLPATIDIHGVVGHLLTSHEALNQSLWQGIRRLPPGHVLAIDDGRCVVSAVGALPISDTGFGRPADALIDEIDEALTETFQDAAAPTGQVLLSGGLDSRIVAACLHRAQAGSNAVMAVTLGRPNDLEASCASRVVRTLGWNSMMVEVPPDSVFSDADLQLTDEHLACGLNDTSWWRLAARHQFKGPGLLTGFLGDAAMGGSHVSWAWDRAARTFSFDAMMASVSGWGLAPATVRSLLLPRWRAVVDEVLDGLALQFAQLPVAPFQRAWAFDLANRQRYHVAGAAHRIAYAVWPSLPLASRPVLTVAGSAPASMLMFRQLQKRWLISRAPKLARLPLDNNSLRPRALLESVPAKVRERTLGAALAQWRRRFGAERRYYYRVYDFNNPGWMRLRGSVRTDQAAIREYFDIGAIAQLLGAPERPVRTVHAIRDVSGLKTLLGLCLLSERLGDDLD